MKNSAVPFVALVGCLFSPMFSHAQALLDDNFDSYPDQSAFVAAWTPVGNAASGVLQGTNWVSAARGVYYGTTAQHNEHSFTESGAATASDSITFSSNFFDSDSQSSPYRQSANLQNDTSPSSSGRLISFATNNNLTATNDGDLSSTNATFFDDVKVLINQVPEPTIAAFLGLSLCTLIGIHRFRK